LAGNATQARELDTELWRLAGPTEAVLREAQAALSRLDTSVFVRSLDALHLVNREAPELRSNLLE
jgi:hypothetical protein